MALITTAGQSFRTIPNPNYQPAVYGLSIRLGASEYAGYNFPLTPSSIRKEYAAMTGIYDVQGPPTSQGVSRVADQYGLAPPRYFIEGTTGWQRHSADGYLLTGLESIQVLDAFMKTFAQLNAQQVSNGAQQLYTMEFYDYFSQNYWEILPEGPQGFNQDNQNPLLTNYRFRFAATRELSQPVLGEVDALAQVFGTSPATAVINAATTLAGLSALYFGPAFSPAALLS